MSKKSWLISYINLLYKMGQDFLNIQYLTETLAHKDKIKSASTCIYETHFIFKLKWPGISKSVT